MIKYALFDWDNTLRNGFTIKSWMGYLHTKHMVSDEYYANFLLQFELYDTRRITYCQLSDNTTAIYAGAVAGKRVSSLEDMGYDFCIQDNEVFSFTNDLLHYLRENGIEVIIISGAPDILLKQYSRLLGIDEVYGLVIKAEADYYMNIVEQDYGTNKSEIVQKICTVKDGKPIFALGDSIADEPLINVAKYGCYIDKDTETISLNNSIIGSMSTICEKLKSIRILSW